MLKTIKSLSVMGVLLSLLALSACSTATPTVAPTLDTNPLRTQVAATVWAQVTRNLARTPSATPIPSLTATATATITVMPTQTANLVISATPTITAGTPITGTVNLSGWVSQSVADDTIFAPGAAFTLTWQLKNIGTSTWTPGYMLRFYSGNRFTAPQEVLLGKEVLPGETVDITLQMKAPITLGVYQSVWVMATNTRANFKEPVYLQIVVAAITATPAP
jgi:hypothetical protein